jgi:CheY-like chemotaxis protein
MAQTILVIDDSASLRQVVAMALKGAGYDVLEAGDGQAALALLDGRKVHMAVCDVNMPRMNGIEFVKAAKAVAQLPLHAHPDADHRESGVQKRRRQGRRCQSLDGQAFSPTGIIAQCGLQTLSAVTSG